MKNQEGSMLIISIIVAVGFIIGGLYIYNLTQQKSKYYSFLQQEAIDKKIQYDKQTSTAGASQSSNTVRVDWKPYISSQYKFSIQYPSDWQYKENDPPTPNLNKYHVTFFSSDHNSIVDLAIVEGNYEEAKKGLSATKKIVEENVSGVEGFSIIDEMGNKSLTFFKSPLSSNETIVLTCLTKSEQLTLESIKNTLKFSK